MLKLYKPGDPNDWSGIVWIANKTDIPSDMPPCGWKNELCITEPQGFSAVMIFFIVLIGILTPGGIISVCVGLRKYRFELALTEAARFRIDFSELVITWHDKTKRTNYFSSYQGNVGDLNMQRSSVSANWKGDTVSLTKLNSRSLNPKDRHFLIVLRDMKQTTHENIVQFLGISQNDLDIYVIMVHSGRGSVQDILVDDGVRLNWDIKVSVIIDIACGMNYLHQSSLGCHSQLRSSKCVLDSRWTCKITGYGVNYMEHLDDALGYNLVEDSRKLLWTAPEILQDNRDMLWTSKSKQLILWKADVYSFAIIMQEVIFEKAPFTMNDPLLCADDIVVKVKIRTSPAYRPVIAFDDCPNEWKSLMEVCWHEDPDNRPLFPAILKSLKKINNGKLPTIVDSMATCLEKYATNLEDTVDQRTKELLAEKYKMRQILCELLPEHIAVKLMNGVQIQPELFEECTVLFSDIVGFTYLASSRKPMDIVKLLNQMYSVFDKVAGMFDVYKVATIGDAYMVSSGIPIRNGDQHAHEVCALSLALLKSLESITIQHPNMEEQHLKLRIGIHSGPCVGGVAGLKMPRYLLFGDTVDIAARMESGGEPMRIHISEVTKNLLPQCNFIIDMRPVMMSIKGTIDMVTYWLTSSD